jgi:restriction endonuclease Mrr
MYIPIADLENALVDLHADDAEHHHDDAMNESIARRFNLSAEDQQTRLRSGRTAFANRVDWAKGNLVRKGLLERLGPKRGAA